jgi:Fe-S cluster biogenesis protein NfuA/nitrite reductase/ring-hydroxylating ferredoxin subunit
VTGPAVTSAPVPEDAVPAPDLRATGDRIEALLEAASGGGRVARERAEELVRLVVDLYGAGLERLLEIAHEAGRLDDVLLDRLAADDLVASLLAVHGLHPYDVGTRVARALDAVRPYLGSHGGDVEFLGLTDDGAVRLRMLGSCDGCPSSSVTLTLAVETAIRDAAPEVSGIEVEEATPAGTPVIPVSALRTRLDEGAGVAWTAVDGFGGLSTGQAGAFTVAGTPVVGVRIGSDLFAYRDRCPVCTGSLVEGAVERRLGGRAGDAVLRCPTCSAHFDVRRAGRGLDGTDAHLEPVPLLVSDGVVSLAVSA